MFKSRYTKLWLMLAAQLGTPVLAQPITVNTRGTGPQPVVGVTNGVPIINIAPPGTGGVSDNSFNQFNVGAGGVVLNNGISDSQTQLAGQIAANPLLDGRPASVILNRVAGSTSMLRGPLEVAGQRANVIVANPNGITCDGCGFFNVNRATLTTGRPQVGPTDSITFDVGAGGASIKINGKGLNSADRYVDEQHAQCKIFVHGRHGGSKHHRRKHERGNRHGGGLSHQRAHQRHGEQAQPGGHQRRG